MLLRFSSSLLLLALLVISTPARSQSNPECFLQDPTGRNIDLSRLCGNAPAKQNSIVPSRGGVRIPIKRRVNGIPAVEVVFNGKYRYEMLFDTGASSVVLTDEMAQVMGVKRERTITAHTAGGLAEAYLGQVRSVQAGNLRLNNLVVGIAPQLIGEMGLLGQNFFHAYDVIIRQNYIELHPR